jgi:hypothetical protein
MTGVNTLYGNNAILPSFKLSLLVRIIINILEIVRVAGS